MNKQFRGHTVWQWLLFSASAFVAFSLAIVVPPCWQLANIPVGPLTGLLLLESVLLVLNTTKRAPNIADTYSQSQGIMVLAGAQHGDQ